MQPPPVADPALRRYLALETKWYWLESTTLLVDLKPFEGISRAMPQATIECKEKHALYPPEGRTFTALLGKSALP